MSRIGKLPVPVPGGVKCELKGTTLVVTGPKGTLQEDFSPDMKINIGDTEIVIERSSESKEHKSLHGLTRSLIYNMVVGVTQGYERTLQIEGVGYRASLQGKTLNLQVGYSHPVAIDPPDGITFTMEGTQTIKVAGINKQEVGQIAANIRAKRKPEPYKGKGIRYENERIRRKVGKTGSKK